MYYTKYTFALHKTNLHSESQSESDILESLPEESPPLVWSPPMAIRRARIDMIVLSNGTSSVFFSKSASLTCFKADWPDLMASSSAFCLRFGGEREAGLVFFKVAFWREAAREEDKEGWVCMGVGVWWSWGWACIWPSMGLGRAFRVGGEVVDVDKGKVGAARRLLDLVGCLVELLDCCCLLDVIGCCLLEVMGCCCCLFDEIGLVDDIGCILVLLPLSPLLSGKEGPVTEGPKGSLKSLPERKQSVLLDMGGSDNRLFKDLSLPPMSSNTDCFLSGRLFKDLSLPPISNNTDCFLSGRLFKDLSLPPMSSNTEVCLFFSWEGLRSCCFLSNELRLSRELLLSKECLLSWEFLRSWDPLRSTIFDLSFDPLLSRTLILSLDPLLSATLILSFDPLLSRTLILS